MIRHPNKQLVFFENIMENAHNTLCVRQGVKRFTSYRPLPNVHYPRFHFDALLAAPRNYPAKELGAVTANQASILIRCCSLGFGACPTNMRTLV